MIAKDEEAKKRQEKNSPKFVSPFEIKKLIENSVMSQESIIQSLEFPDSKNALKIIQSVREISLSLVKKVQSNIHKSKHHRKRLNEMYSKAKRNAKSKGALISSKEHKNMRNGEFINHFYILLLPKSSK